MPGTLKRYVRVKCSWDGLHYWPGAQEPYAFLGEPHRHKFLCEVTVGVDHEDREIEFLELLDKLQQTIKGGSGVMSGWNPPNEVPTCSCEQMGERILGWVQGWYGKGRYISVAVYEDGENGGLVEWSP